MIYLQREYPDVGTLQTNVSQSPASAGFCVYVLKRAIIEGRLYQVMATAVLTLYLDIIFGAHTRRRQLAQ